MAWVAEILRRTHRICGTCNVGPTHIYDPELEAAAGTQADPEAEAKGRPLCNACLAAQLAADLSAFEGRALIFEPALGPEALVFHPLEGAAAREWPAPALAAVKEALASLPAPCARCAGAGRFRWIPVEADAYFWPEDLLGGLSRGEVVPSDVLCGACTAARLTRSLEERGLYLDAIVPPRGGDGVLLGSEI